MNVNNTPFTTASFFTSFHSHQRRPSLVGLPISPINRSFLQSPLWNSITTTKPPQEKQQQHVKKDHETPQQTIYVLPKSPSNVSIYLQLPAFRQLSVFMRHGHISQLLENWLCNPMEQLKRNAKFAYKQQEQKTLRRKRSSSMCIMPTTSSSVEEMTPLDSSGSLSVVNKNNHAIVPYQSSSLFIHFQLGQQSQPMEIQYAQVPCLYTIVCVTYHCGSVSVSINQIESVDSLFSSSSINPFLVKCEMTPNHPVTIHQLTTTDNLYKRVPQLCDSQDEDSLPTLSEIDEDVSLPILSEIEEDISLPTLTEIDQEIEDPVPCLSNPQDAFVFSENQEKELPPLHHLETVHLKESVLYYEEEDDDDESYLYSSSEEYSVLDDVDTEDEEDAVQTAFLRLVQDTLQYVQSSHVYSDELKNLEQKMYSYCRTRDVSPCK